VVRFDSAQDIPSVVEEYRPEGLRYGRPAANSTEFHYTNPLKFGKVCGSPEGRMQLRYSAPDPGFTTRRPHDGRFHLSGVVLAAILLPAVPVPAQPPVARTEPSGPAAVRRPEPSRTPPRTRDGRPDLQGVWTNATYTPLERPSSLADKTSLTEDEAAAYEQKRRAEENSQPADDIHYDNVIWLREKLPKGLSNRRTSIVIDPPDGRIPPMTPAARQRAAARAEERKKADASDVNNRTLTERCIIWPHVGPPMLPAGYNSNLQIVQTPAYVMIVQEMIHDVRVIPLDGRPHLPAAVRQWMGDARGRWEGDTLVVETTNFTERTNFRGSSGALRVVERFTPLDAETIRYQFTVDDPTTWTRPWTGEIDMRRFPDRLFEYACHEGNHDLQFLLQAAQSGEPTAKR
jgi:hypothetical protein